MFSRRAPLFGASPESTVKLIKADAERSYLRSLTVLRELGDLKLVTRKDFRQSASTSSRSASSKSSSSSSTRSSSQPTTSSSSANYELLFRGNLGDGAGGTRSRACLLSLWRLGPPVTEAEALDRLQVLARLLEVIFSSQSSPHRKTVQTLTLLLQRLVNAMAAQPGWRAVHIAAYVRGEFCWELKSLKFILNFRTTLSSTSLVATLP